MPKNPRRKRDVKVNAKIGTKVHGNKFTSFFRNSIKLTGNQEYDLLIVDYDSQMEGTEGEDDSGWNCSVHPSVFFLLGTLVLTTCATGMLCGAIMTDHWEEVTWDRQELDSLANNTVQIQWLLDGTVAKVSTIDDENMAFLVPIHGGIWTLCLTLTEEEILLLRMKSFPKKAPCVNYLAGGDDKMKGYEPRWDWQHRMQNLSISCALVCLIILGSAALVGAFGVCQHQISAVLVTGVMYLLAASFALFTLTIIHFKRTNHKPRIDVDPDGSVDGVISVHQNGLKKVYDLLGARIFTTSWSLDLGWGGVMLCVMTSVLWILLSKIMRFNPISSMIN